MDTLKAVVSQIPDARAQVCNFGRKLLAGTRIAHLSKELRELVCKSQ